MLYKNPAKEIGQISLNLEGELTFGIRVTKKKEKPRDEDGEL